MVHSKTKQLFGRIQIFTDEESSTTEAVIDVLRTGKTFIFELMFGKLWEVITSSTVFLKRKKESSYELSFFVLALTYLPSPSPDKYFRHW